MKIILLEVTSLDGRFTKGTGRNVYEWSSPEDFAHFAKVRAENNLLVMGSGTFDQVKAIESAGLKPEKDRLRVVMTKQVRKYALFAVAGQLEFSDATPKDLVASLEKRGYTQMLFVGGGKLLASFLADNLIDEVWLTLEPKIFGSGDMLVAGEALDISLHLLSMEKLNEQGTLLLKYKILKN